MNSHNWSSFDQTFTFTEHSKNSSFNVTNDNLNPITFFQNNHEIHTDSFHSNSANFMHEESKQQDNSFISTKNVQRSYVTKKHQKCTTSDNVSSQCFIEPSLVVPTGIRRRGPKKKPDSQERVVRMKMRRARANARERSRMHGLNSALDALRQHIPSALIGGYISFDLDKKDDTTICTTYTNQKQNENNKLFSKNYQTNNSINQINNNNNVNNFHQFGQKLSKIETLRLACNYIGLLASILNDIHFESITDIIKYLCHGLSQITTNQIAAALQSDPSRLMKHHVSDNNENKLLYDNSSKLSSSTSSSPIDDDNDDVNYTKKIQQNVIRSNLLTDEQLMNHLDYYYYYSNNVSLTIPTNQSTSISNVDQSLEDCSSNCIELLKSQNDLFNNKLYEYENVVYDCEQYEMNEYNLTIPYLPINYNENIDNNQLNESMNHEHWINKTKLQLFNNEEINVITPLEINNSIHISMDSKEPILNSNPDLKSYSYHCHYHHLNDHYYDSY
ncbi:unnamed protein product [Schistosoma margrebowiei]|uniref:BHLH domain-containing protein n=1 Tax=Schistosoma margrebowiei TaxID=48269 RepID=A0AA84ZR49_9TREM|nr:unnamed protein product [Schistosoma margrebowiei]